ncbi:MAG: VPLPA-CTERM sorting domain-containing protein [Litoreibacter sp.]|nr:VPLPA-CTERM sorting domain-containing protein [Litoreibacter sp.]MCY4335245.1 VPLPA-CTERM sorting domain-containing protein [Litoreibacter sp.]
MIKASTIAAGLAFALAASAQAAVFDFNDAAFLDTTVDSVTTSDGSITATLTTKRNARGTLIDGIAAIFDTQNPNNGLSGSNGDNDLTEGSGLFTGTGFGGALIISETGKTAGVALSPADDNASGGTITFDFGSTLVNLVSFDILDDATVTAISNGVSVTAIVGTDGGFGTGFDLSALTNVSTVTFDFNGASGAIDNFVVNAVTPVPLPAGLPLLLAGLGGFALLRRRK